MRHFTAPQVDAALDFPSLIDALAEAFRGGFVAPPRASYEIARGGEPAATTLWMPAWTTPGAAGGGRADAVGSDDGRAEAVGDTAGPGGVSSGPTLPQAASAKPTVLRSATAHPKLKARRTRFRTKTNVPQLAACSIAERTDGARF